MAALASPEASMAAYYAARATEYEAVYAKPERQADLRLLEAWLPGVFAGRRVLEVAAGTGWWTLHGARDAAFVGFWWSHVPRARPPGAGRGRVGAGRARGALRLVRRRRAAAPLLGRPGPGGLR